MKGPVEPVHRSVPESIQEVIELTGFLCFLFRSTPKSNTNTQIHLQKSIMEAFSQTQRGIVKCNLLDIETLPLLFKPRKSFQLKFCQIVLLRRKTLSEANVIMDSFGELTKISPMCLLPVSESRCSGSIGLDWHRRPFRAPNPVCRF